MRRKSVMRLGNLLMGLGLVGMSLGIVYAILSQLPQLSLPDTFSHSAVMGIFIGAFLWLIGACLSGREKVADRYWWVRHYDKRSTRHIHPRH